MKFLLQLTICLVIWSMSGTSYASHNSTTKDSLWWKINEVVEHKQATIGVSFNMGDTYFAFNNVQKYPLMSVFKFHVAFAALRKMESEKTVPNEKVYVSSSRMQQNTYSPLRDRYSNQDFESSYAELIRYAISESDNNACDLLIDYVGGIEEVARIINALGLELDYALSETEATMHTHLENCYMNWSTPLSVVRLIRKVYTEECLTGKYDMCLKEAMVQTTTGMDKIRKGLPEDIVLGHKTGSSDRLDDGTKMGDNDAGIIYMPNGKECYVAIFIKDSKETDAINADIIARIAQIIYQSITL